MYDLQTAHTYIYILKTVGNLSRSVSTLFRLETKQNGWYGFS